MLDCKVCKDYRKCTRNCEWFSYQDIRFCPEQIIFIISNSATLLEGNWPLDPDGSVDPSIRTGYASEAYYVKAVGILAEVNGRLAKTGKDGKILKAEVKAGETLKSMESEAYEALMFIKGFRNKKQRYSDWKKQRRYRDGSNREENRV